MPLKMTEVDEIDKSKQRQYSRPLSSSIDKLEVD